MDPKSRICQYLVQEWQPRALMGKYISLVGHRLCRDPYSKQFKNTTRVQIRGRRKQICRHRELLWLSVWLMEKFTPSVGTSVIQGPGLTTLEIYDPITIHGQKVQRCQQHGFSGRWHHRNKIYAVGGVAAGLGPAILPTVEQYAPSLSVAALDKLITFWGQLKTTD